MANTCTHILVEMQPLVTRLDSLEQEQQTASVQGEIAALNKQIQALFIAYGECIRIRPEPVPLPPR